MKIVNGTRLPTITDSKILGFFGEYRFLSNFHYCKVEYENMVFPSSEHAYMAAKTKDLNTRALIRDCKTPNSAKNLGQKIELRDDWELIKVAVMTAILYSKFTINSDLEKALLDTGDRHLEESNNWGDKFWGVHYEYDKFGNCTYIDGKNNLGHALMTVRNYLRNRTCV